MARLEPDPNDPLEPRIWTEWRDKIGQVYKPGDYVAYRRNKNIYPGLVQRINKLKSNKQPIMAPGQGTWQLVNGKNQWVQTVPPRPSCTVRLQLIDLDNKTGRWFPMARVPPNKWNRATAKYEPPVDPTPLPVFYIVKDPNDILKLEGWKP